MAGFDLQSETGGEGDFKVVYCSNKQRISPLEGGCHLPAGRSRKSVTDQISLPLHTSPPPPLLIARSDVHLTLNTPTPYGLRGEVWTVVLALYLCGFPNMTPIT